MSDELEVAVYDEKSPSAHKIPIALVQVQHKRIDLVILAADGEIEHRLGSLVLDQGFILADELPSSLPIPTVHNHIRVINDY